MSKQPYTITYHAGRAYEYFDDAQVLEFYAWVVAQVNAEYPSHWIEIDSETLLVESETDDHENRLDINEFCDSLLLNYLCEKAQGTIGWSS